MTQERWQVSDSAATQYERFAVGGFFAGWADDLLQRAALQPSERVLDVACGTGIVARKAVALLGATGSVTGVDLNAGMLAEAGKHVPEGASITWRECDAAALPFDDASFDVVLCQQGVQFMPDKAATVAEMHRVLAPGGRALASVWRSIEHNPCMSIVAQALGRHVAPEVEAMMNAPFAYHNAATLQAVFEGAGFTGVQVEEAELTPESQRDPGIVQGLLLALPMAERVAAMPESARETMLREILDAIPGALTEPAVLAPESTHVVTARR